jgi:cell division protein FtsZ
MTIDDIERNSSFVDENRDEVIIKVIGVGGGGDNAVNHMYEQGIRKVSFVVCNTDKQALNNSVVPNRLLIGPNITKGLGAGNNPELARQAAEESADEIARLFDDETKMVFITAGMGGGTGTGAGPVVARIAQERGLLTIGIVTIPFFFEGEKKIFKALDGAEEMSKYVDALLVVNNEQLTEIYPDLDWMNAFGKADDTLSNAARSISELITCDGYMNLDFNDVNTTLRNGGAAIISTGFGEGEHRVTKAIEDALNSPLLKNKDIFGSKRLLFNLYFSREADQKFVMGEAKELTSFISNIDKGVDVIYGIGFDETLGNKIKITILAAGFELSIKGDKKNGTAKPASSGRNPFRRPETTEEEPETTAEETLKNVYGEDKVKTIERDRASLRYIILQPDQFDDDSIIETFEHSPAYNRDKKIADEVRNTPGKQPPREKGTDASESPDGRPSASSTLDNLAAESNSKVIEF